MQAQHQGKMSIKGSRGQHWLGVQNTRTNQSIRKVTKLIKQWTSFRIECTKDNSKDKQPCSSDNSRHDNVTTAVIVTMTRAVTERQVR